MSNITVLAYFDRISVFHSLVPFLFSRHRGVFTYTDSPEFCLRRDENRVLFMVRRFLLPDRTDLELLARLREKYETIVFFNGNAGGGIPRLEVLPYVDRLYNKALFRDRALYERRLFGGELYSDYYQRRYGVEDPEWRPRAVAADPAERAKLRISWNVGLGDFPRHKWRQRGGAMAARIIGPRVSKLFFARSEGLPHRPRRHPHGFGGGGSDSGSLRVVHARLGTRQRPSIAFHRNLVLDRIDGREEFLTGFVRQLQFNREIREAPVTLSPFGWGEVCFRDFEAVRYGSLLLKPDMSHLETWPDIYAEGETYAPFDWDANTLVDTARRYLDDPEARRRITEQALDRYLDQVQKMEARLEGVFEDAGITV